MTERNYTPIVCAHCGSPYEAKQRNRMYCSSACNLAAWKLRNPTLHRERSRKYAADVYARKKAERVKRAECLLTKARAGLLSMLKAIARDKAYKDKSNTSKAKMASSPCEVCGAVCGYTFGRARKYCSAQCCKAGLVMRAARKASKAARKARARGVHAEAFHPFEVFDRDGWACQLCKVPTSREKRGTYDDDAPELDHIVPLSKGGPHTMANTQCACRRCNRAKSDNLPQIIAV